MGVLDSINFVKDVLLILFVDDKFVYLIVVFVLEYSCEFSLIWIAGSLLLAMLSIGDCWKLLRKLIKLVKIKNKTLYK